jgi:hypothetical protein
MKLKTLVLVGASLLVASPAKAVFGLPDILISADTHGGRTNVREIVHDCRRALHKYLESQYLLIDALDLKEELAARKATLKFAEKGGAEQSDEDMIAESDACSDVIRPRIESNKRMDEEHKKLAAIAALKYVQAAIETKKMVGALTNLNTSSLGLGDVGPVLYLVRHVPPLVSNAVSTTSKLLNYLSANNVDVTEANKAASDLGV